MKHRRSILGGFSALVVLALVSTGCLLPGQFDPTGGAPIGSLDLVVDAGGAIRVVGWALDPETAGPIVIKVGSEGVVHDVVADSPRSDIAAAYPGHGAAHGFDYTFSGLAPGLRGICVWAPNTVGVGDDRLLGCANIEVSDGTPIGSLDFATSLAPRTVTVGGWVFDKNLAGSSEIVVNVDGQLANRSVASNYRPDVGTVFGRPNSGFQVEVPTSAGSHQVCVATFNAGPGVDRLLGCRTVVVAESTEDRRPVGELTAVTPASHGTVMVTGEASDPDGSAGLQVRLDIDTGTPDAQSVTLPVSGGVFSTTINGLEAGLHTICPVGLDVNGGFGVTGDRAFICGSTVVGELSVGTGGAASDKNWVAPSQGHPLRDAERDAGVSVELSDGSVMWFFGDTLARDSVGNVEYFVNNTAAWASAGAPTVTRDGTVGNNPVQFVSPPPGMCDGAQFPTAALWPESAVAVPQGGGTDKVLVFASKVCLGTNVLDIEARGMALVELDYDSSSPPVDTPVTGAVTQANLFDATDPYGRGAVLDADETTIYTYQCGRFDPADTSDWGPCNVGRVDFVDRTVPANWEYWDGGDWTSDASWVASAASAAPIESPTGSDVTVPVAAFTVTYDAAHNAWLMVYSPWPGFTDRVEVRVADTPVGPFSDPVTVYLPGCNDTTGGVAYYCYAGTAQPKLSSTGLLGVGYYDQLISVATLRAQYVTVTVPFSVVVTPAP